MSEIAIDLRSLGKMYKLFSNSSDKFFDAFGFSNALFWRKNTYKEFWALRGLNLQIKRGERIGLIGRNGAGKTTTLKIITGNVTPTEGTAKVNGKIQALMELGTGFHPEFTGRQNIRATLSYQGLNASKIRVLEEEIIDFSELEDFIDQPIKTYSAGMYARLAFSAATAIEPEILIIDEVLGAGDAYFAGKCVERMRKLTEASGATVLFVSHDLSSVQALCDRVIWIDRGTLKADGEPLSIIKQYSAVVRQDEEIRLMARDLKISKKQAAIVESFDQVFERLLFRFINIDGNFTHPVATAKVRRISLYIDDNEVGAIAVGGPTDNNLDERCHVIDTPGYMNWGPSENDEKGYYRLFADFQGKYYHAPFEFAVPKGLTAGDFRGLLKIEGDFTPSTVALELFNTELDLYQRITLLSGQSEQSYELSQLLCTHKDLLDEETHQADELPAEQVPVSEEYGSQTAVIKEVKIFDAANKETKTLTVGQPFHIDVAVHISEPVKNPVFTFCAYALPMGITASQWVVEAQKLGVDLIKSSGIMTFQSDRLLLGKGTYVATVGIYAHHPRDGGEPPAYHVLDRAVHFQVIGEDSLDMTDYGLCVHPLEYQLKMD